ncbi:hydroxymethylglutaryl-CoA reductase, degradative [Maribacter sp. MAR_2009_72]|uniref:hydroxymethylglutaryl-CoA reductase, degradative n=1 Tax=Maribacter sp. MAR_2009_72 TaxID=1250050 RepID=UPI0011995953|nr:hydroxymethylglutaryl-CoA reductase, degradative [Maribacter sp. MAR_2009_72]TVZ15569.1 3-hydroxy-3-methylglutaryl-coenzyme A reductase [Maribacter sp. MAR_2009_72]
MTKPISGFSKLTKEEKIDWITTNYTHNKEQSKKILQTYWNQNGRIQQLHDEFIENTITNLYVPQGIAPNFLINDRLYAMPMAIEESSVIAAASKAAKFWLKRGGFKTEILGTEKVGQVHFLFKGDPAKLNSFFTYLKPILLAESASLTTSMQKRGGGITDIALRDKTHDIAHYYQLHATFQTKDAMGANFINSCLEQFASTLKKEAANYTAFSAQGKNVEIVMSILSNYVPNCTVRAMVSCPVEQIQLTDQLTPQQTAEKIIQAIEIARVEPYRAVTHNKGIMNGIDAVVLATGNDFRAVEAGVHAYACKDGQYRSLTHATIDDGIFKFWIEVPLALGTVGGLTNLHPLVKLNLEILQHPSSEELMQIIAVAGLAQNFAAVSSLVTTGIQKGHMKMHLLNILNQLGADENEKTILVQYFKTNPVTHHGVELQLKEIRK